MSLRRWNPKRDRLEKDIIETIYARGGIVRQVSSKGLPDLLVGYLGKWLLVEVKDLKGELTDPQKHFLQVCNANKLPLYVVRSTRDMLDVLALQSYDRSPPHAA